MNSVEAQALAYALEIAAVEMTEVRAWADAEILRSPSPETELLALATAAERSLAISLLHRLGRGADRSSVGRRVYSRLLQALSSGTLSPEMAGRAVARLALENAAPSPEAAAESSRFDDAFYLANSGIYGTEREVVAELNEHLKRYAA